MLAALTIATRFWKIGVGALAGILIGWAATFAYVSAITVPHANTVAVAAAVAQAQAAAAERQKAAQDKIDAIERQYLQHDSRSTARISALEQALAEAGQQNGNGSHPACRVAIPRGVSDKLDDIGRAAPREDPAVAPAGVP